jgi:hypothetical protein
MADIVTSVFGRPGPHVVAETGDYATSQITNDSQVPGATADLALDNLAADVLARAVVAGDLEGAAVAPKVARLQGRAVQDVQPNDGDYLAWSTANSRWEPRPRQSGAALWGAVYQMDLRTLPTQDLATPGEHVVDGYRWYTKGSVVFNGGPGNAIVNGQGLHVAGTAYFSVGANHQRIWFPFSQLEGFDPATPVAIAFRYAGSGLSSTNYMVMALASALSNDASAWSLPEQQAEVAQRYEGAANAFLHIASGTYVPVASDADYAAHVFFECRLARRVYMSGHALWSGALPTDAYSLADGVNVVTQTLDHTNPGLVFTRNQSSPFTCYLTHIAVLQPKVAG